MPEASYYSRNKDRWKVYHQNHKAKARPPCVAETLCEGREYAQGFCHKHYKRWYRHGVLYSPKAFAGLRTKQQRSRDYYLAHREERIAYVQSVTDPKKKRQYDQRYNQRPEVRARKAEQRRRWALENWDKYLALCKDSSLRRRKHRFDKTAQAYIRVLLSDPCSYCGQDCEHIDHIAPLKYSGDSSWSNLTAACASCNQTKYDQSLLTFLSR